MRKQMRVIRALYDLTQPEAAERLGVSISTYTAIEAGTRAGSVKFWVAYKKAFNLDAEDLWRIITDGAVDNGAEN